MGLAGTQLMVGVVRPLAVTVSDVDTGLLPVSAAVMVVFPLAIPVATPWLPAVLLIVATLVDEEFHVTRAVQFWVIPPGSFPVAVNV
jgi:hypothetical protein